MKENVYLYISVPSNRAWLSNFGTCFADLLVHLTSDGVKSDRYVLSTFRYQVLRQASNISQARQYFVDDMLKGCVTSSGHHNFTHWLSLDDDMTFPADIVDRLLVSGHDIVSCNARRKIPELKGSCQGVDGNPINSVGRSGTEELRTMGGAIFLAKIDAFRHIPKPHFQVMWSPAHNDYISEDTHFATLLKINGVKMYCDHDASKLIGHIGDHDYRWEPQTYAVQEDGVLRVVA